MIVSKVIDAFCGVVRAIFGGLPSLEIPFFSDRATGAAGTVGNRLALVKSFLPVVEGLTVLYWLTAVLLPAVAVYVLANWAWRHVPEIWGFGTGGG